MVNVPTLYTGRPNTSGANGVSSVNGDSGAVIITTASIGAANSSHTHTIANVTGLQSALDGKQPLATVLTNTTAAFTTAQESKLSGIAAGAEVNVNADWNAVSGDAQILNKPTIPTLTSQLTNDSGFLAAEGVDDRVAALLVAGANVTLTYDDSAGTLTIASTGGGGGSDAFFDGGAAATTYSPSNRNINGGGA